MNDCYTITARFDTRSGAYTRIDDGVEMMDVRCYNATECLVCTEPVRRGEYIFIVPELGEVFHTECVRLEVEEDE